MDTQGDHEAHCVMQCCFGYGNRNKPLSIPYWQSVFRHILGQFPVSRVCSAKGLVDFWLAECVPLRPGRVCSATALVDFRLTECVPSRPGSISD